MQGTRAWRKSGRRREGADLADPQDLHGRVKAVLPEVQCPVGRHEAHWQSACRQCVHLRVKGARSHAPPRVRQGVVNPPNGTNGPPTPCYDVQYESSAGWPTGGDPYGYGAAVVVSGRESRPHGQQCPPAKGSRLPRDRVMRYARCGEPQRSCAVSTRATGEPDDAKVSCPVRKGAGRKGGDIRPRLRPTLPCFRAWLTASVRCCAYSCEGRRGHGPCAQSGTDQHLAGRFPCVTNKRKGCVGERF